MATEVKTVFVSSSARTSVDSPSSSFTVYLQNPVKDVFKAELLYASVPNSVYNLTNGSNVIQIDGNTYSIPTGYYGVTGLATELTYAIKPLSNVTATFLSNEGKYVLWRPDGPFTANVLSSELSDLLGIPVAVQQSSETPPLVTTPGVIPLYAYNTAYSENFKNFINCKISYRD